MIALLFALLPGCRLVSQPAEDIGDITAPAITPKNYPRLDGSTSTEPLGALIACRFLEVPCRWMDWIDGERRLAPDLTDFQGEFPFPAHNGTHQSYVRLIEGETDLILVARQPSEDESLQAAMAGVWLDSKPIALDAFVFIANENNPVDDLSQEELQDIYTGEITNWGEVGGKHSEIHPYQRDENSGSQELMRSLVMKGRKMIEAPDMILLKMFAPFYAVSDDPLGIGYSVYYYEENMAPREQVKLLAVDGVKPDPASIRSRQYPFATEVYAIVRGNQPKGSLAYQLWQWLGSVEGQALVAESGYVPLK